MKSEKIYGLNKEKFPWPILRSVSLLSLIVSAVCVTSILSFSGYKDFDLSTQEEGYIALGYIVIGYIISVYFVILSLLGVVITYGAIKLGYMKQVCLIGGYLLVCSLVILPLNFYFFLLIDIVKIIFIMFMFNLGICIPFIHFFCNQVNDINKEKVLTNLLLFAYGYLYILLHVLYVYIVSYLGGD